MKQGIDRPIFPYIDAGGNPAFCHLQAWACAGCPPVAMVTEVAGNPGRSVMNSAGNVWRSVSRELGQPPDLVMIEHYRVPSPPGADDFEEHYSEVTFKGAGRFTSPFWRQISPLELKQLIGGEGP